MFTLNWKQKMRRANSPGEIYRRAFVEYTSERRRAGLIRHEFKRRVDKYSSGAYLAFAGRGFT